MLRDLKGATLIQAAFVLTVLVPGGSALTPSATFKAKTETMSSPQSHRLSTPEFRRLLQSVADGWNAGDARKAADCYTEDAIYSAPPDPKYRQGRKVLYEFFGGDKGRDAPMRMAWHHSAFDDEGQIGFAEYTFSYKGYQAHGVVAIKLRGGKISHWREYEMQSDLSWQSFIGKNDF